MEKDICQKHGHKIIVLCLFGICANRELCSLCFKSHELSHSNTFVSADECYDGENTGFYQTNMELLKNNNNEIGTKLKDAISSAEAMVDVELADFRIFVENILDKSRASMLDNLHAPANEISTINFQMYSLLEELKVSQNKISDKESNVISEIVENKVKIDNLLAKQQKIQSEILNKVDSQKKEFKGKIATWKELFAQKENIFNKKGNNSSENPISFNLKPFPDPKNITIQTNPFAQYATGAQSQPKFSFTGMKSAPSLLAADNIFAIRNQNPNYGLNDSWENADKEDKLPKFGATKNTNMKDPYDFFGGGKPSSEISFTNNCKDIKINSRADKNKKQPTKRDK